MQIQKSNFTNNIFNNKLDFKIFQDKINYLILDIIELSQKIKTIKNNLKLY
jgi:hypothetical protein